MLIYRILPFLIIGGGFLICREIFKTFPLSKKTLEEETNDAKVVSLWIVSLFIIIGQFVYIFKIFSKLFSFSDALTVPIFIGVIVFFIVISFIIFKNYEG
jgi:hypothetical protein